MRLTLRTLMAYRDGVLSKEETRNLHKRIKQSEVAGNLLRRIESIVQRIDMQAPPVDATGLAGDPNSVAEYLDDALAGEKVPEFERICIAESDVQLAELAHCHQLLADAMHSQVRVPQQLKVLLAGLAKSDNRQLLEQRLLRNAATVEAIVVAEPTDRPAAQEAMSQSAAKRGDVEQPRNSDGQNRKIDGQLRRFDSPPTSTSNTVLAESTSERPQVQAPMVTSGGGSIKPQGLDLEGSHLAHEIPEYLVGSGRDAWRMPLAIGTMLALLLLLGWLALGPIGSVKQLFDPENSLARQSSPADATGKTPRQPVADPNKAATENSTANARAHVRAEVAPAPSSAAKPDTRPASLPTSVGEAVNAPPADEQPPTPEIIAKATLPTRADRDLPPTLDTPVTVPPSVISWSPAGMVEQRAVLFARRVSPEGQFSLIRLAPQVPIAEGTQIVVPPATRSTLNLAGKCEWTVCGPTQMQASLSPDASQAQVVTPLCKALVKPGTDRSQLEITTPAGAAVVTFQDATSMAAVEVTYRAVASGLVTDTRAYKPLLIIVSVAGRVTVEFTDKEQVKSQTLNIGEGMAYIDNNPRLFKLGEIPAWYRGSDRPIDQQAALDLDKLLPTQSEIGNSLQALCNHRRPETAALAIQASMLLGDWNPFAQGFLNNEAMRNHWASTLSLSEQLLASEPGSAVSLQQVLDAIDPQRGKTLFALMIGFREDQQPSDFFPPLIDLLDSSRLDERVLATNHLRRMTGKDFGYQPHFPSRASVQQWRREFTANRLKVNNIGDPLWEAK